MEPRVSLRVLAAALLLALSACSGVPAPSPPPTLLPPPPTSQPAHTRVLAIVNGTVIDGTGAGPIVDGVVVIEDDRVVTVGRAADVAIPSGAEYVDAKGGTILPGIINAHVHSTSSAAVRRNDFLMITVNGGYPDKIWHRDWNYEVATPDEARSVVADLVNRGADVIKIPLEPGGGESPWPMLNLELVQAIVREAHARGKLVRVHLGRTNGAACWTLCSRAE